MIYIKEKYKRTSIRLKDYDYAQPGAYFITICTHNRECLLGNIVNGEIVSNEYGKIVEIVGNDLTEHYPSIDLDRFIIMPNHIHGIILLKNNERAGLKPAPTKDYPLSEIIRAFKTFSSRRINELRNTRLKPV